MSDLLKISHQRSATVRDVHVFASGSAMSSSGGCGSNHKLLGIMNQ